MGTCAKPNGSKVTAERLLFRKNGNARGYAFPSFFCLTFQNFISMFRILFFDESDKLISTHTLEADNNLLILADARDYAFRVQDNHKEIFRWKIYQCMHWDFDNR